MIDTFEVSEEDLKLKLPFGLLIAGPSSSGKTTFLLKLLNERENLITPKVSSILFCYSEYQPFIPWLQKRGILVHRGQPTEEMIDNLEKPAILIFDDMLYSIDEDLISNLYTKMAHHRRLGVIFLTQNLFDKKIKVFYKI